MQKAKYTFYKYQFMIHVQLLKSFNKNIDKLSKKLRKKICFLSFLKAS